MFDFDLLMNLVIGGAYLFLSSQPLRELNPSSERALLVPDHPTKERALVRRSWMKISFAPRSAFINLGSIAEFFFRKGINKVKFSTDVLQFLDRLEQVVREIFHSFSKAEMSNMKDL